MNSDPVAGRDPRVRLVGEAQSFERIEPLLRRSLLMIGVVALGIGVAHGWAAMSQKQGVSPDALMLRFAPPGP